MDSSESTLTERLDSFLDGFGIVDAFPANLNTEQVPCDWKGPFPGLIRDHDNYNFKSPIIYQTDIWKKGLEVVLQPNSTLVMRASTRSQKEVVPLQDSTLVMFESKTSTGSEETQSSKRNVQEYRTSNNPQSFQTMFPELEHPALQIGNLVAPALYETGMPSERQDIATSSQSYSGVTSSTAATVATAATARYPLSREDIMQSVQHTQCAQSLSNVHTFQL